MPTYDFRCLECQAEPSVSMSMTQYTEGQPHKCPCGGTMERIFKSAAAIHDNLPGFYGRNKGGK